MYKFKNKHRHSPKDYKTFISVLKAILLLGSLGYIIYKYHKQIYATVADIKTKLEEVYKSTGLEQKISSNHKQQAAKKNKTTSSKANKKKTQAQQTQKSQEVKVSSNRYKKLLARQQEVYSLIKELGEATLTDIASRIQQVSKRTLRRDMDSLEEQGLVKQVGKTRDSHYQAV